VTLDLEKRLHEIIDKSEGRLDFAAVTAALTKSIEEMMKAALDNLERDGRIKKNHGNGAALTTYEKKPLVRRA
jgi:hypothetical protein